MDSAPSWETRMIEVKSRDGWTTNVYSPLLSVRWGLFAKTPTLAIKKLSQLPSNTVQSILEHLYANTPVSRTNLPAFKACKIVESIPFVSTYNDDMMTLLNDTTSSDFSIYCNDEVSNVPLHKFILYARCDFFKELFLNSPLMPRLVEKNFSISGLRMFSEYLYTGDIVNIDLISLVELFGAGKTYGLRDPEEIDFLAQTYLRQGINTDNASEIKAKAHERGLSNLISMIDSLNI